MSDWEAVTCARCGETGECTPRSDYYTSPLWTGEGRVCEGCFQVLVREHFRGGLR